jgi:maleylpyruvate isomerase
MHMPAPKILYDFFRSAAAYRVRIVLNLKEINVEHIYVKLRNGEHKASSYKEMNPQGLVPTLTLTDGTHLTQSLAILDYLDSYSPANPLNPKDPLVKAKVQAFALCLAADTHPVQNLGVLERLRGLGITEDNITTWAKDTNIAGLNACEAMVKHTKTRFAYTDYPSIADICLVPQLFNARRWGADVSQWTRLLEIEAECSKLEAFAKAHPSLQADAQA